MWGNYAPIIHSHQQQSPQTHLIIFAVDQGQFEAVLCGVDGEDARPALSVQAVNTVSSHTGDINGQVQCPDDAVITAEPQSKYHVKIFKK